MTSDPKVEMRSWSHKGNKTDRPSLKKYQFLFPGFRQCPASVPLLLTSSAARQKSSVYTSSEIFDYLEW